jgi:hypothetical protein
VRACTTPTNLLFLVVGLALGNAVDVDVPDGAQLIGEQSKTTASELRW